MTSKQLFNIIDGADDRFLKEAMEDDLQYPVILTPDLETGSAAKTKRRFPIKPIAACAACLALVFGLTFIGKNVVNEIDPLFGKPARGVITKIAEKDLIDYTAKCGIGLGPFSYPVDRFTSKTDSQRLYITKQTTVSTTISLSIKFKEHGFPADNVPARVFLLADGKPIDFKLNGAITESGHPELGVDVVLSDPRHENNTYFFDGLFDAEFTANSEDEQFAAVATFFPDEVFDLREAAMCPDATLTAVECVRNSAAKVSYDYGDNIPGDFPPLGVYVHYDNPSNNGDYSNNSYQYENMYVLKKNLGCKIYRNIETALRQYVIIDGKLLNCFGNEYLKELECHGGNYFTLIEPGNTTKKFTIPRGFIPSSGMHIIQTFQEPVIPEIIYERVPGYAIEAITFISAETLDALEKEAQKYRTTGHIWCNDTYENPVRVSVSTDKLSFKKGEKIKVKATIRNYGTTPIQFYSPDSSAGVYMYISRSDAGGDLVNTDGYYERGVSEEEPTVLDLGPGEEYNVEFNFVAMVEKDGEKVKAPEGQYRGYLIYQFRNSTSNGNGHTYTYLDNRSLGFTVYI